MPSTGSLMDRIHSGHGLEDILKASYSVINAAQDFPPAAQVMGITAAFAAVAHALNVSPGVLLSVIDRAEANLNAPWNNQIRAIKAYTKGELK